MVKLAIQTADQRKEKPAKQPLDDTVKIPLEEQPAVLVTQKRCCTGRTACSVIALLVILAVGGALIGVYLQRCYSTPVARPHVQCFDWGPECPMKGPPVIQMPPKLFRNGPEYGDNEAQSGQEIKGPYGHHNGRQTGDHKESSSKEYDRDGYHPRFLPPRHHPQQRKYPPGTAGPQGDSDGHQKDSPAL